MKCAINLHNIFLLQQAARNEEAHIDDQSAVADANRLIDAGEGQWGTDESAFNSILISKSFQQLQKIFQKYEELTGNNIEDVIKREFSGSLEDGYLAVGELFIIIARFYKTI